MWSRSTFGSEGMGQALVHLEKNFRRGYDVVYWPSLSSFSPSSTFALSFYYSLPNTQNKTLTLHKLIQQIYFSLCCFVCFVTCRCYVYITKKNNIIITIDNTTIIIKFRFPPDFWINSFVFRVTRLKFCVAVSKSSSISFSILYIVGREEMDILYEIIWIIISTSYKIL